MTTPAVQVRFVGMLFSARAEALVRACIGALDALVGEVARWDVCLQPPLAPSAGSGYAVRAQARMNDGSLLSLRAQGESLEGTVRDAFEALEEMLLQESGAALARHVAGLPATAATCGLPA